MKKGFKIKLLYPTKNGEESKFTSHIVDIKDGYFITANGIRYPL